MNSPKGYATSPRRHVSSPKRMKFFIKNFTSAVLVSLLVLVVTVGVINNQKKNNDNVKKHITLSKKALVDICHQLDFKDTCEQNLPFKLFGNNHRAEDFLRLGMEAAMNILRGAAERAITLQGDNVNLYTKNALQGCSQLVDKAINDLQRSLKTFLDNGIQSLPEIMNDHQVWVSGSLTYQQTCLDAFLHADAKSAGPIPEQLRMALAKGMELTTNALGMAPHLTLPDDSSPQQGEVAPTNRRLKSLETFPEGIGFRKRALLQGAPPPKPDVIVAQDGSGKYKTINEALKEVPVNGDKLFVIYIKAGVYNEKVVFNVAMTHLLVYGDGPTKTKITGAQNVQDGQTTFLSATAAVEGDFFMAKDIGFENTAGQAKGQAVALRVGADKVIFHNCQIDGYQDTLYTHTYRQFYRDCVISGTVDFVFGDAAVVFQNCKFLVRKGGINQVGCVMAQSRVNVRQPTGCVLQNCTIVEDPAVAPADKATAQAHLARPWTENSRSIIMESFIGDIIRPEGYTLWNGTFGLNTLYYAEYNNRGPSSPKDKRVKWQGIRDLNTEQITRFTPGKFLQGDTWIPPTKVPYESGFMFPPDPVGKKPPNPAAPGQSTGVEDIPYQNQRNCYHSQTNITGVLCT